MLNKFPIGAWIHLPMEKATAEDVRLWKECGLTLTMSPNYDPEKDDKQKMLEFLDACSENGIKLIVCDKRSRWINAAADPEAYRKQFREAYADFGHHSAVWGFHIGDEPMYEQNDDLLTAYKIQCEEAPELTPFVNFLPLYLPEIRAWLDDVLTKFTPKLICYDRYTQLEPEEIGTEGYFSNLKDYRATADKTGVPMWTTLCSVGHMRYRVPSEDDLRWQFNTAIASGCDGILWFYFYNSRHGANYRKAPLDMFGKPTETYNALSNVLREFHELYGETFTHLKLEKSCHLGKAWGGYPLFKEGDSDIVVSADTLNGTDAILSFFKDENGVDYLAVVCNSYKEVGRVSLTVSKKAGKMIRVEELDENRKEVYFSHHDEGFQDGDETFTYIPWLAPGQMNLYRFDKE